MQAKEIMIRPERIKRWLGACVTALALTACEMSIDIRTLVCEDDTVELRADFVKDCLSNVSTSDMTPNLVSSQYENIIAQCQIASKELYCEQSAGQVQ